LSDLLFYEDVPVGLTYDTGGLLVTDTHIVQFAGLSGDSFDVHMDDDFARSVGFNGRIAHGLLGTTLIDGLKNRAEKRFAAIASLSSQWNFRAPLYPDTRIFGRLTVAQTRLTRRGDRGILTLRVQVLNNQGDVLQEGTNLLMVRTRSTQEMA
jgi:3-hydroxybutyryl-CoA dehydratase